MMIKRLMSFVFGFFILCSPLSINAANAFIPLFLNPFKSSEDTYESRVPSVVSAQRQQENQRSFVRDMPVYESSNIQNPLSNPNNGYLRIKGDMNLTDPATGQRHNQYDLMTILAARGDTQTLRQLVSHVQQNGTLDPAKYRAAIAAAKSGGQQPNASGAAQTPSSLTSATGQQRVFRQKQPVDDGLPKKVHRGYDEVPQDNQPPQKNQPIFLR
jgi:hypothetical protein